MRNLHFSTLLLSLVIAGCSSTNDAACTGTPPVICDGCCGIKSPADQCLNGAWTCRPSGAACAMCDAGPDSAADDASGDAATCTGTPPLCFGNNSSLCCGNDPSGSAACLGGVWMCGSASAPGCNGTSCLQDTSDGQTCAEYTSHGPAYLPSCSGVDAGGCSSGNVCTATSACCGGGGCRAATVFVCCPPSGC
jgi:hypothetical protein